MPDTETKQPEVEIKVEFGAPDDESQTPKVTAENIDELMAKIENPDSSEAYTNENPIS